MPLERRSTSVGEQARGVNHRLIELSLLLICPFDEARAWVRALEHLEPVTRDARGARTITTAQLERIAVARLVTANRGVSRVQALRFVARLGAAHDALAWLDSSRAVLGSTALEARVALLEAKSEGQR